MVDFSAGLIYYTFPNLVGDNTSPEIFAGITLSKLPYSPSFRIYYDMNLGDGVYLVGSISQSISHLPLTINTSVDYNQNQYINDSGISDVALSCSYDLKIRRISLSPSLNYAYIPMKTVNNESEFWASVRLIF